MPTTRELPKQLPQRQPDAALSSVVIDATDWQEDDGTHKRHATLLDASTEIEEFLTDKLNDTKLTVCDANHEYAALVLVVLTPLDELTSSWEKYHTGGGCWALIHDTPSGGYALITNEDGSQLPTDTDKVLLGYYDDDGQPIGTEESDGQHTVELFDTLAQAKAVHAKRLYDA